MKQSLVVSLGIGALVAWMCFALFPFGVTLAGSAWEAAAIGQWGDSFGALNALFSALAFVAVLYTLRQQQKQIDEAALDQHMQRFERTFYELLRLLREARDAVEFRYSDNYDGGTREKEKDYDARVTGTEAFKRAQFELRYWVAAIERNTGVPSSAQVAGVYTEFVHGRYESTFAP